LSRNELRYCLAENVRLESIRQGIDVGSGADVDAFNQRVDDYNSRCGAYRYQKEDLESVQQEIERARFRLEQEGKSRFRERTSRSIPAEVTSSATVLAVQRRLNELGYDAVPADGFGGTRTRGATRSYQRYHGMPVDGLASTGLLANSNTSTPRAPRPASAQPTRPAPGGPIVAQLTLDERRSLESACAHDPEKNEPSACNECVNPQIAELQSASKSGLFYVGTLEPILVADRIC
jgi:hypothetical protein